MEKPSVNKPGLKSYPISKQHGLTEDETVSNEWKAGEATHYLLQIHFGKEPKTENFFLIQNPPETEPINKPVGAFWTSTYTPGKNYLCDWQDWCLGNEYHIGIKGNPWLIIVKKEAKIITPRAATKFVIGEDYEQRYDWEAMSKAVDGFNYNEYFFWRETSLYNLTRCWDCLLYTSPSPRD